MNNLEITNPNEFAKSDFDEKAKLEGLATYSPEHVKAFTKEYKGLIEKAEKEELTEEENTQMKLFKAELESLKAVVVVGDDLEKKTVFYRKKMEIEKSEE